MYGESGGEVQFNFAGLAELRFAGQVRTPAHTWAALASHLNLQDFPGEAGHPPSSQGFGGIDVDLDAGWFS